MSEEIINVTDREKSQLEPSFKKICFKLGIMMIVIFLSRIAGALVQAFIADNISLLAVTVQYAINTIISFIFLYAVPITAAVFLFRGTTRGMVSRAYKKPVYFANAMGMFPAMYGITFLVNIICLAISLMLQDADLAKSFNTVNDLQPTNLGCAVILFVQLAVIAPIFEEYWFRGIVMEALKPFGNGFAILVSALLFGMTHANFQQFFYATILGIALGYIAVSTKSIVTTTIMHAIFNSISGIMLLFLATESVGDYLIGTQSGATYEMNGVVAAYVGYLVLILLLMVVGVFMAIVKLGKIKKYKVPKVQQELTAGRRWKIFFSRITIIVTLLLAADAFTFQHITNFLYKLFTGALGG